MDLMEVIEDNIGKHREMTGRMVGEVDGLSFVQDPDVFSPSLYYQVDPFIRAFPHVKGEVVWEVGCGVGVLSVKAALQHDAQVVATDVNPVAIDCVRENAQRHGVSDQIDCRVGSLFEPLNDEKFDTIYWNWPFPLPPEDYVQSDPLEIAFCDPGYELIDEFLGGVRRYLEKDGRLLLTFGSLGNADRFFELVAAHGFEWTMLSETTIANGRTYWLYLLKERSPAGQ